MGNVRVLRALIDRGGLLNYPAGSEGDTSARDSLGRAEKNAWLDEWEKRQVNH
jgi:hypothetical protein